MDAKFPSNFIQLLNEIGTGDWQEHRPSSRPSFPFQNCDDRLPLFIAQPVLYL
jgi:hypothetical protein